MESQRSSISAYAKNKKMLATAPLGDMLYAQASEEYKASEKKAETSCHLADSMASLVAD